MGTSQSLILEASKEMGLHLDGCIKYHTITEFAALAGVAPNTVRKWIDAGMPFSDVAKRVPCKDARDWLNQN